MDAATALTIANNFVGNLKDAYSSLLPYVLPSIAVIYVTFALIRWVMRAVRGG